MVRRKQVGSMTQPNEERRQPVCLLAQSLLNKVSAIVGFCDLLKEEAKEGTVCARRLASVRDLAVSAAEELVEYQCRLFSTPKTRRTVQDERAVN
jgi:hypothetical protein